jgi:diadenosine tetraphosphate (Ap4A) HIT family hydrolase
MIQFQPCVLCLSAHNHKIDDAALIIATAQLRVVWANEAGYPCFIMVIWQTHIAEMSDLTTAEQAELWRVIGVVERAMRDTLQPAPAKINLASLGNYVPHLHWHIIPRYTNDAHWPNATFATANRLVDAVTVTQQAAQRSALATAIRFAMT